MWSSWIEWYITYYTFESTQHSICSACRHTVVQYVYPSSKNMPSSAAMIFQSSKLFGLWANTWVAKLFNSLIRGPKSARVAWRCAQRESRWPKQIQKIWTQQIERYATQYHANSGKDSPHRRQSDHRRDPRSLQCWLDTYHYHLMSALTHLTSHQTSEDLESLQHGWPEIPRYAKLKPDDMHLFPTTRHITTRCTWWLTYDPAAALAQWAATTSLPQR